MIKIEKNIPFPINKYPWREMELGDSFAVPLNSPATSALSNVNKRYGIKFASRTVVENGARVKRIWRIE
jgi:hypothetical protein